jgi:hypothetical protein
LTSEAIGETRMSTAVMMQPVAEVSPRPRARITGGLYLLYFLTALLGGFFTRGIGWRRDGYGGQPPGAQGFISVRFSNRPHRDRVLHRGDGSLL